MCFNVSHMQKAQRSGQRSAGVSDLLQTILPVHSEWNERKAATPPAFFPKSSSKNCLLELTWGDWWGMQDGSSAKEDISVSAPILDLIQRNLCVVLDEIFEASIPSMPQLKNVITRWISPILSRLELLNDTESRLKNKPHLLLKSIQSFRHREG